MNIGFIGLGRMGWPIAKRLMTAGHRLTIHDIDESAEGAADLRASGASWADSPGQAAEGAELVFTSLPGPREVEEVALAGDSILTRAENGSVYIDLTTSAPDPQNLQRARRLCARRPRQPGQKRPGQA